MPTVTFDWTGQVTDKNDRKIQPGEVVEMTNIRRKQDGGTIQKRLGYDRTSVSSFQSGATYTSNAIAIECADVKIVRDGISQLWLLNTDGVGYYRGKIPTASHTLRGVDGGGSVNRKPCTVYKASTNEIWTFCIDYNTANKVRVTVTDAATGILKVKATTHTLLEAAYSCCAVVDASNVVWFFHTNGGATIYSCKFSSTADVAPSIVVYVSLAARVWTTIDAILLTAGPEAGWVVVYADRFSFTGGGVNSFGHHVSRLNVSTGVPSSAVEVSATYSDTFNAVTEGGSLFGTGAGGVVYVGAYKPNPGVDNSILLVQHSINTNSLVATTTTLATISYTPTASGTSGFPIVGAAAGYVAANGDRVIYASFTEGEQAAGLSNGFTGNALTDRSTVTRYTYNGTTTTTKVISRSAWIASKPFQIGSEWYFLTGFDDGLTNRIQRGYFLRDADGLILDDILNGSGTSMWHGGAYQADNGYNSGARDGYVITERVSHTVRVPVISGKAYTTLLQEGLGQRYQQPTLVEFDFAPVRKSTAPGVVPGGVPMFVGARDVARELAPIHAPHRNVTFTDGGGAVHSTTKAALVYATLRADGDVTRSAPRLFDMTPHVGFTPTFVIPTYHHAQGPAWIELYMSTNNGGDRRLQYVFANDPTVDTISVAFPVDPFFSIDASAELLYTSGGALENSPAPPARVAVEHQGRLFLFGTEDGLIYFSQEKRIGRGFEFNEVLAIDWPARKGSEWWAAEVSPDVLAFGDGVSIGLISGPGPDGLGVGAFQVNTVASKKVPNNPHNVTTGPLGAYFIARDSNRPCLLTAGGVQDISKGFENYRGFTFGVAAGHVEGKNDAKGEVFFIANSGGIGRMVVLDCDRPLPGQEAGTWILHEHSGAGFPLWLGAQVIGGQMVLLEIGASGVARTWAQGASFSDNGTICLKRWKTGRHGLDGFLREFDSDRVSFSSTRLGGDSAYRYTVYNDQGAAEVHTDAANVEPDVGFRTAHFRTREISMLIEETSATGEGRKWDGCAIEFNPYDQIQNHRRSVA